MTSVSDKPRKSPGGKAYVEGQQEDGTWACVDLGWPVSGDTGAKARWMFGTVTLKLEASVINTTLGQDSNWTQINSDQRVGHQ